MVDDGPQGADGEEDDDDEDACDDSSEYDYTGSSELHQAPELSRTAISQQEISISSELKIDGMDIAHFQQPHASLETHKGATSMFEPHWTGTTGQIQTYGELPTPGSDSLSWFNPLEVTTSQAAASQTPWLARSPMDEQYFQNSGPLDIGYFDIPGSKDDSRSKECVENSVSPNAYIHGENTRENKKKGSVILTLSQVDPHIAHEIMGSVLKHSAGLKIQCVVNDN